MWKHFFSLTLRTKLIFILIIFAVFPALILTTQMLSYYTKDMVKSASTNVHSIVVRNNNLIRAEFIRVEDVSSAIIANPKCFETFENLTTMNMTDILVAGRTVDSEITRAFSPLKQIYQTLIYSPYWVFGQSNTQIVLGKDRIEQSGVLQQAYEKNGATVWLGGCNYAKLFNVKFLLDQKTYDYQYPIMMVRKMDFQYIQNGSRYILPATEKKPVLISFVLEETVRKIYANTNGYENTQTFLINESGVVVSSNSQKIKVSSTIDKDMLNFPETSGYVTQSFLGEDSLLCYDTMEDLGWMMVTAISMNSLIENTSRVMRKLLIQLILIMFFTAIGISIVFSNTITRPITALIRSSKRAATGDFSANTPVPMGGDFKALTENFNQMETQISQLIEENYIIQLREKDTQIMALNLQINPHFLYNTLNIINLTAIKNHDEDTSDLIVSLSQMLQYTFKNNKEKIPLIDEINWTKNYLYIMSMRYEGVFDVQIQAEDELLDCKIPKFFLQPLVENSVMHGFEEKTHGGIISISAKKNDDSIQFIISDNGKGMTQEEIEQNLRTHSGENGIGIANVHSRLSLIYGNKYRVKISSNLGLGTSFDIIIPYEK